MTLEEVKACCRHLNSDKVIERKKAADQLKHLLNNENIIAYVSSLSKSQRNKHFNWDQIFFAARQYLIKESEKLEKEQRSKGNPSLTTQNNWANTKAASVSLLKLVLKRSCKGVPHISLESLLDFVSGILTRDRPYLLEHYAGDAIHILQQYILFYPQYYLHVPQEKWKEISRIIIWIHDMNTENVDLMAIVVVMDSILKIFCESKKISQPISSPSILLRTIPSFMCKVITSSSSSKHYGLQCAVLSLLCTACSKFGIQWRNILCRVGEETFDAILAMWDNKGTAIQLSLLKYLNFQLIMHFPQQDGNFLKENEFACEPENWKRKLNQLYLLIFDNLTEVSTNSRVGSSFFSKENLPDALITLAARLFAQIFRDYGETSCLDITQVGATPMSNQATHISPRAKRRRVQIGFPAICEMLKMDGVKADLIPWYCIVGKMLKDYREFFTRSSRAESLLDVFLCLLPQCKSNLVMEEIFVCLNELADKRFFATLDDMYTLKKKWTRIAEFTTRFVAGKQCPNTGMRLLQTLILNHLIDAQTSLYRLFLKGVFPLNQEGLELLTALLITHSLPKTIRVETHTLEDVIDEPRISFIRLLLPLKQELQSDSVDMDNYCLKSPGLMANLLALLTLQNSQKVQRSAVNLELEEIQSFQGEEEFLEELLLKSLFSFKSLPKVKYTLNFDSKNGQSLCAVKEFLIDRLKRFIEEHINYCSMADDSVYMALSICQMLVHLWPLIEDKRLLHLLPNLKDQLKYIEEFLSSTSATDDHWNRFASILTQLNLLFSTTIQISHDSVDRQFLQALINTFPSRFQEVFLRYVKGREVPPPIPSQRPSDQLNNAPSVIPLRLSLDSFDPDFDEEEDLPEITPQEWDTTDYDSTPDDAHLTFTRSSLCPKDISILLMMEWLAKVYELTLEMDPSADDEKLPFVQCIKAVFNLTGSEKMEDQIIAFSAISLLFTMKYHEDNIEDGFKLLATISGKNSSDSRVIAISLRKLKELLMVNGTHLNSADRTNLIHLIKVLAEKVARGLYGLEVSELLLENLVQLTKLDATRSWSSFTVNEDPQLAQVFSQMKNPYLKVRMKSAASVSLLFQKENTPLPFNHQKLAFEQIHQTARNSLKIEGNLHQNFMSDERWGREASFVACLCSVASASPALEAQALYALVLSTKVDNINADVVIKALRSSNLYLLSHLPFFVSRWVQDQHPVDEFPFLLFECPDLKTFESRHYNCIVSALFSLEDGLGEVQNLARRLAVDEKVLIEENFAPILAFILPYLVVARSSVADGGARLNLCRRKIVAATRKWEYLEAVLGREKRTAHIINGTGEVVLHLLRLGHDSNPWYQGEVVAPPPGAYFEVQAVLMTLSEGHVLFFEEASSLLGLLCERKSPIHCVIHGLFTDVLKAFDTNAIRMRWALANFEIFLLAIIPLVGLQLRDMEHFIVRKLAHMLTHLVEAFSSEYPKMAEKCCHLLRDFFLGCLNARSATSALTTALSSIVPRLHSLHRHPPLWTAAYNVLLTLFSSKCDLLREALSYLAPFSADKINSQLENLYILQQNIISEYQGNICLRKKVKKFLQLPLSQITSYDIQNISDMLTEKSVEIPELYLPSGSCRPLLAHELIHQLVSFISRCPSNHEGTLSLECLGKLGPVNLNTFVFILQPVPELYSSNPSASFKDRRMILDIVTALNRLTFSRRLSVVETSVSTLRRLLALKNCFELVHESGDSDLELDLRPFLPLRKPKTMNRQFEDLCISEFELVIGTVSLWEVQTDYGGWLSKFTTTLIEAGCGTDLFNHLIPVSSVETSFCQLILPYVFHNLLKLDDRVASGRRQVVSRMFTYLVELLCQRLGDKGGQQPERDHVIRSVLTLLIEVINHLRSKDTNVSYSGRKKPTEWDRNLWLDLDFLLMAKAAFHCGAFFSAILFAEIACENLQIGLSASSTDGNSKRAYLQLQQLSPLQRVSSSSKGKEISALLLQVYSALALSNGVEGCGVVSLATDFAVQSTLSFHRGHILQALSLSEAAEDEQSLLRGLRTSGLYSIVHRMASSTTDFKSASKLDVQAECAWRLGQWGTLEDEHELGTSFNSALLKALSYLKKEDSLSFMETRNAFDQTTLSFLRENGNESTSGIYPVLAHLQIFSELSEIFRLLAIEKTDEYSSSLQSMLSTWKQRETLGFVEEEEEKILAARVSALKILRCVQEHQKPALEAVLFRLLLQKCKTGNLNHRCRALREAEEIKVTPEQDWLLQLERVKLTISLNNSSQAVCALDTLIRNIETASAAVDGEKLEVYYDALTLCGKVLARARTRSPKLIIDEYYGKAISLVESKLGCDCKFLDKCYHELASFGDHLYQEINLSLNSDHSKRRQEQMNKSSVEINRLRDFISARKSLGTKDIKENHKKLIFLERDFNREKKEFERQEKEAHDYLCLALKNYLKLLASSSKYDLTIFRVVALWFENLIKERPNALVYHYSSRIKSHKFIPLLYQLVARLTNQESVRHHSSFPKTLTTVLENLCLHHPHHSLPVVLMLASSHLDEHIKQEAMHRRGGSKNRLHNDSKEMFAEEDRVKAAKDLIGRLRRVSSLTRHIAELESLFSAYISLAHQEEKTEAKNPLSKLKNFQYTAPLTRPIPIQESAQYSAPLIAGWKPSVELVGGINAPLKLTLYSSDGKKSNELLKGNDDLRQDAVLEQVFSIVNKLLQNDAHASRQKLSIKTYMVAPLSQKTGVIEWCDNTTTLGKYLPVIHKKYFPQDFEANTCRQKLAAVRKKPLDVTSSSQSLEEILVKTMEEIFNHFHPAFRFFFYEEYPSPERWFTQRCSYTRSVATSSIAGYILGLGDRHGQNLLLDVNTAEVIHIDLGIAFENGKNLPTPERVPFRMTQDIIDGFGVMGIEGPLRKNMETTLRVLRETKSILVTIVEVLRHDPLHHWTLSPSQIAKLRQLHSQQITLNDESNSASMAEKAVIRVQQKLNGLQDGRVLSVSEHVSVLLQQATDLSNLAQMYDGWQPYL